MRSDTLVTAVIAVVAASATGAANAGHREAGDCQELLAETCGSCENVAIFNATGTAECLDCVETNFDTLANCTERFIGHLECVEALYDCYDENGCEELDARNMLECAHACGEDANVTQACESGLHRDHEHKQPNPRGPGPSPHNHSHPKGPGHVPRVEDGEDGNDDVEDDVNDNVEDDGNNDVEDDGNSEERYYK